MLEEYCDVLRCTMGTAEVNTQHIEQLHKLGYLPLHIRALPEGTKVPIQVPMIEVTNTHPDFAWVVNAIESLKSCTLWHQMLSANVGYRYREIVELYYSQTVDDYKPKVKQALGDFSMRGQESLESAIKSSAGFLLSFENSATVPAYDYLRYHYNHGVHDTNLVRGAVSTEHSVMCSNREVDGDEITMVKRLLTELYPGTSFSMVADSYDYWNMVQDIIPACSDEINAHEGVFLIRGDSGDPVEITVNTVVELWKAFGGTKNKAGYKLLPPKIRVIYGDGITPGRCRAIYDQLKAKGFSAENVRLGVGSFSFQCLETIDEDHKTVYHPYTRDTFGIASKTTACQMADGTLHMVYKDPKTDVGGVKKSHRGLCHVYYSDGDGQGVLQCEGGMTPDDVEQQCCSAYQTVFIDGSALNVERLETIRERLHQKTVKNF